MNINVKNDELSRNLSLSFMLQKTLSEHYHSYLNVAWILYVNVNDAKYPWDKIQMVKNYGLALSSLVQLITI